MHSTYMLDATVAFLALPLAGRLNSSTASNMALIVRTSQNIYKIIQLYTLELSSNQVSRQKILISKPYFKALTT